MSEIEQSPLPFEDQTFVNEQIGNERRFVFRQSGMLWKRWADIGRSDYEYFDKVRRARAEGFEVSGLLIKPLSSKIAAWVMGRYFFWQTRNERVTEEMNRWWRANHPNIMRAYKDSLDLGDAYIVLNGDSTLTVVSPDRVEPIVDENDFERWIGWRITTSMTNASSNNLQEMTYIDEYTAEQRVRIIQREGAPEQRVVYDNPLGKVPVIHVINRRGSDEMFGRPEAEDLLPTLMRYGDVLDASLKGNIRQGRPTPVISEMGSAAQLDAFYTRYGRTETITYPDGRREEIVIVPFDPDQLLTLAGEAKFKYEAPGSFSTDTLNLLGILFYLIVQNSEIPEFIWGTAIGSSKASADSQLEPFVKYIDMKRGEAMNWLNELAALVITYFSVYMRAARNVEPLPIWKPMTTGDGRLTLDAVIWAWSKKLIDNQMAMWLLPINISDPKQIEQMARKQWGEEYGNPGAGTGVPASGGGDQQNFGAENPVLPTERA